MNEFYKGKLNGLEQAYNYCEKLDPENKNLGISYIKLMLLKEINSFEEYWDRQLKQETTMTIGKKLDLIEQTIKYKMNEEAKEEFLEESLSGEVS